MDTVRKQKPGDKLAVGDWLAPGELLDGAAEVLYVHSWPASADWSRDNTGTHVRLVVREQGSTSDYSDVVSGAAVFDLATDADLDQLRQQAQRKELAAELRDMADKILNPAMPVPQFGITVYGSFETPAEVRAAAKVFSLPVESRKPSKGIQTLAWPQGRTSYEKCVHLHWLTITEELEPEPEPDPSWPTEAELKPWETLAPAAERVAESMEPAVCLGRDMDCGRPLPCPDHPADPIGLAYTRADDEPDDPTPATGARVKPHVGGMTDEGLVDETHVPGCSCQPGSTVIRCRS